VFVLAAICPVSALATWPVPSIDPLYYSVAGDNESVAYDAAKGKLYYGHGAYSHTCLAVFDVDAEGNIVGGPRSYEVHPQYMPPNNHCYVSSMRLDAANSKLFMYPAHALMVISNGLTMIELDAAGEPTGTVQSFDTGNLYHDVRAAVKHPLLDRLYCGGFGGQGVYVFDLDSSGTPTGSPTKYADAYGGKYSIAFRSDGTKLYLGTYPYLLLVRDLDAAGAVTGGPRLYTIPDGHSAYLKMVANDEGVYFPLNGYLAYYELDATGEPNGDPVIVSNIPVQAVSMSATGSLILAESTVYTDAVSGVTIDEGFVVRERPVGPDGSPGPVLRESDVFQRLSLKALGTIPDAAVSVRATRGFQGNRFSGLHVRFSVDSLIPDGRGAVDVETTQLSTMSKYLHFAQSTNHNAIYATGSDTLLMVALDGTGAVTSVACTNAGDAVAVDDELGVVYVGLTDGSVEVRDLDGNGTPAATGETIATEISSIRKLCVNQQSRHVYVCGGGSNPGPVPGAATPAAQRLVQVPETSWLADAVVDPDRHRLYACRMYNAHDNIMMWRLNPDGTLLDMSPTYYDDGIPPTTNNYPGAITGVKLDAPRNRIYFGGYRTTYDYGKIIVYTLDGNGDLTNAPRLYHSPNSRGVVEDVAISTNGNWLYDVGFGEGRLHGRRLDSNGEPTGDTLSWTVGYNGKKDLAFTRDGSSLLMGTYPSTLEVIPMLPDGTPKEGFGATLAVNALSADLDFFALGSTSVWVNLDQGLSNNLGAVMGTLTFSGAAASGATLNVEFSLADGTNLVALTNITYTVTGDKAYIFLPGYDVASADPADIAAQIETETMRYERYLDWAQKYGPAADDRPRKFMISTGLIGKNSGFRELELGLKTLAALGHNTLQTWNFAGQVPPETIHTMATNHGIEHFRAAAYNPPSYFDFNTNLVDPAYLDNWADQFTNTVNAMGASLDELHLFKLADEPGWYHPSVNNAVTASVGALTVFQEYLQSNAVAPQFFGHSNWADILPMGLGGATNLPAKRLLFWTARFFAESSSRGMAAATAALQRRLNPDMYIAVNLNNWPGWYFRPSPNEKIGNNPDIGPDSAMGGPDWFDFGRKGSVTAQWSEDWFYDGDAQVWSFRGDLLRSSVLEKDIVTGAYVVGRVTGTVPEGGMYKIMALVGHGAKMIDTYTFGPEHSFPGNCWSELESTYESFGNGFRLLGRCEDVAYPGQPLPSTVAILLPQASQVWDPDYRQRLYLYELYGLHCALMHEQYPVDFVDDFGIEDGVLAARGYSTLYVTAPNLSTNAQIAIRNWVQGGGTLALLPGACMADEYNEPASVLAADMGAAWGAVSREEPPGLGSTFRATIDVTDGRLGATGEVTTRAQVAPLTLYGAVELAEFTNGETAVSEKVIGSGRIIAYGYWPGTTYYLSRNTFEKYNLPKNWSRNARKIVTAPARIAGAGRHVTLSEEVIEGAVLESDAGMVVILLNWRGDPVSPLTVNVPITAHMAQAIQNDRLSVSAALGGAIPYVTTHTTLTAFVPLDSVDVLILEIVDSPTERPTMLFFR